MIYSMSRKGECHDSAVKESFFHTLKEESLYDENFATKLDADKQYLKILCSSTTETTPFNYWLKTQLFLILELIVLWLHLFVCM